MAGMCDTCAYYEYDDDEEAWFCSADMDEDDYYHFMMQDRKICPYYRSGDEYRVVRHQM